MALPVTSLAARLRRVRCKPHWRAEGITISRAGYRPARCVALFFQAMFVAVLTAASARHLAPTAGSSPAESPVRRRIERFPANHAEVDGAWFTLSDAWRSDGLRCYLCAGASRTEDRRLRGCR